MVEVEYLKEDRKSLFQWCEQDDQKWKVDFNDQFDIFREQIKVESMFGSNERRLNWWSEFKLWSFLIGRF